MNRKIILSVMFILFLAIDQAGKIAVQSGMRLYESKTVIDGFFNITYILNPGAAFGIFGNLSESYRILFLTGITLLACVFIIYLMYQEFRFKLRSFAYTAVLAGAVGNMIDRVRVGKVVDFLDFYIKDFHWYTFNMADVFITTGIGVLIFDMIINRDKVA